LVELLQIIVFYLLLGAFAGVMAGLLGVGGGLIIVPALAWSFHFQGVAEGIIMHLAIGTSLATIVITSIASMRAHHRHQALLWPLFWRLSPGIVAGALLLQRWAARRAGPGMAALFASGPGLLVAMGQLADGVTSYLAVSDPFGLLAREIGEQVALSAWLIEHTGPAYPVLKWILALGAVYAIEAHGAEKQMGQVPRLGLYLVMLLLGFGPAVFSATQLLL
jgi:hypothetical protein